MTGAIARILLRYVAGGLFGWGVGETLAGDPDIVMLVAAGLALATERFYVLAKSRGWSL